MTWGNSDSRAFGLIVAAAGALAAWQYITLFPFVIDDAFIVLRYARNLVDTGELVFNHGERVSALTSPLHALLMSGLYAICREHALLAYKIVALACVGGGAGLLAHVFREVPGRWPFVLALLIASPSVVLWTYGGLETPLLFAVVAAFTALVRSHARENESLDTRTLVALHFLAAVALLIRYDSVCFFAPALLLTWRHRRDWRAVGLAVYVAAIPVLAWFSFALDYYGDLLPTSFYVKTPSYGLRDIVMTGLYEGMWLTLLGVAPLIVGALAWRFRRREWHFEPTSLILGAGLAGAWIYGLGMAQKHMMFGFRHGMPYLPAAAGLLMLELRRWSLRPLALASMLGALLAVHVVHTQRMLDVSVNGYWRWSQFSEAGARSLISMVDLWKGTAADIAEDWSKRGSRRGPRIFTYAGGVVPYELPDSYIYEELISARRERCARTDQIELAADYVHAVLTPEIEGSPYYNMIVNNPTLSLISDRPIQVGDEPRRVQVFFNREPTPLQLPSHFNWMCPAEAWHAGPCVSESCFY